MAQIHFTSISVFSPTTHMVNSWRHPLDQQGGGVLSTDYWKNLARTLERGFFDGIFFADALALPDESVEGARSTIASGTSYPRLDPLALIPLMADATTHLGFAATLSTATVPPFVAVRKLGTIDNITGGRFAWNVVMGHLGADFRALGMEPPDHDKRYDAGDEYLDICYRLWDAFPREAVLIDKQGGVFVDNTRIGRVDYDGQFYKCHAYPIVMRSPQGRPLIFQAGQSGRGMRFGVTHGDANYAIQSRVETMKAHMAAIRSAAKQYDAPHEPRVFFGLQPFIGGTEEEARRTYKELQQNIPVDVAISLLSALVGIDLAQYDLDISLEEFSTHAGQGLLTALQRSLDGRSPSVKEAALQYAMSVGMPQCMGTPEQVADWIEGIWREVGCYGFAISSNVNPMSMDAFADEVVPILQKRGLMRRAYAGTTFRENLMQQDG